MQFDPKQQYDVIIIGSGAGGGTLAYALSQYNLSILVIEKGGFLPKEPDNRSLEGISGAKYRTPIKMEVDGRLHDTYTHAYVGGQTKLYGAALYRLRRDDFKETYHSSGVSPAWPISYDDLEPYYTQAEHLYKVHGSTNEDPTEPAHSQPYQYPPIEHENYLLPFIKKLKSQGLNVSYIPKAIDYADNGKCEFCGTCDGYACELGGKLDTEEACLQPAFRTGRVHLLSNAECKRLNTSNDGKTITSVDIEHNGNTLSLSAPVIVLAGGVLESPALLLRSANKQHPAGLANSSGLVGRYLSGHNTGIFILPTFRKIPEIHQKTFAINDYYNGSRHFPYPMGLLQAGGRLPVWLEVEERFRSIVKFIAERSIITFIMSEVLPEYNNRTELTPDGHISVKYQYNNVKAFRKLRMAFMRAFWRAGYVGSYCSRHPIGGIPWHPVGTLRFGNDPGKSVLNTWCQTHDIDNLYVVDSAFLPTAGSVNTSLTVMAQALRVAPHLAARLNAEKV